MSLQMRLVNEDGALVRPGRTRGGAEDQGWGMVADDLGSTVAEVGVASARVFPSVGAGVVPPFLRGDVPWTWRKKMMATGTM